MHFSLITCRDGAYHWDGESFTRLLLSRTGGDLKLEIAHYPVKQVYSHAEEYRSIMIPLIEEEWRFTSKMFKESNTTQAIVMRNKLIETVKGGNGRDYNLYATKLSIELHKGWTATNEKCITRATLEWNVSK